MGAWGQSGAAGQATGAVFVFFLTPDGGAKPTFVTLSNATASGATNGPIALPPFAEFGSSLAFVDIKDGVTRLAVGAPGVLPAGRAFVVSLQLASTRRSLSPARQGSAAPTVRASGDGAASRQQQHRSERRERGSPTEAAEAAEMRGAVSRSRRLTTRLVALQLDEIAPPPGAHNASGLRFGAALAVVDDRDGDGQAELAIGAPGWDGNGASSSSAVRGAVYIVSSAAGGGGTALHELRSPASALGDALGDEFGRALSSGADWDGNGLPELVVGAPAEGSGGALYILYVTAGAQFASTTPGGYARISAEALGLPSGARLGQSVALLGAVDGDLVPDLIAGGRSTFGGLPSAGALAVVFLAAASYPSAPPQPSRPPPISPPPPRPLSPPTLPPPPPAAPPPVPPAPTSPLLGTGLAVRVFGTTVHGYQVVLVALLLLGGLAALYIVGIRKKRPADLAAAAVARLRSGWRSLRSWYVEPSLELQLRSDLRVEVRKGRYERETGRSRAARTRQPSELHQPGWQSGVLHHLWGLAAAPREVVLVSESGEKRCGWLVPDTVDADATHAGKPQPVVGVTSLAAAAASVAAAPPQAAPMACPSEATACVSTCGCGARGAT